MATEISLLHLMNGQTDGWGHQQGRMVHGRLLEIVEAAPESSIFRISLKGVRRTDASFPRESVVQMAKRFRGHKGFCLADGKDPDLLENWDAAAMRMEQPLFLWTAGGAHRLLGPQAPKGSVDALDLVTSEGHATASQIAKRLDIKINNASMKLRQLQEAGYLLREEEVAESGGVEFTYFRIK